MIVKPLHIPVGTGGITICPDHDGRLRQLGFGPDANDDEPGFPVALYPQAFPVYGENPTSPHALRISGVPGDVCRLAHLGNTRTTIENRAGTGDIISHRIQLVDQAANVRVVLRYDVHTAYDLVAISAEVSNMSAASIRLEKYASSAPLIAGTEPTLTHFGGGWAAEWTPTVDRITPGAKVLRSFGGVQPHLHLSPAFLVEPAGVAKETSGVVFGAISMWTGNTCFEFHADTNKPTTETSTVRVVAGASSDGAEVTLAPHETFTTPPVIWGWSIDGRGDLSRRFHRWIADEQVRDGDRTRAIVWNNWEATAFEFDEARLISIIDDAATLGAEMFLLDDGWFGNKYPRIADTQGLGDWEHDRKKLPRGLGPVITAAIDRGIRFGLWIEPEMVNPRSELNETHPEWALSAPGHEPWLHRNQLVLDLCRDDVSAFVVGTIDRLIAENPGISYLKWDANRPISEPISSAISADRSTDFWVRWNEALQRIMEHVATAHPDIELMLCASGGGRVDPAALAHFHEVWPSDNTDPVFRVRMQWAMSTFFPALVVGAHVTRWGNRPVAFGCAVAMSARFGFDIDPAGLTEPERTVCARACRAYKEIAHIVQHGDLFRLVSPMTGDNAALMYSLDENEAVVFAYQLGDRPRSSTLLIDSLRPEQMYNITAIDLLSDDPPPVLRRTGEQLASDGLWWPLTASETAAMWWIRSGDVPVKRVIDLTDLG